MTVWGRVRGRAETRAYRSEVLELEGLDEGARSKEDQDVQAALGVGKQVAVPVVVDAAVAAAGQGAAASRTR